MQDAGAQLAAPLLDARGDARARRLPALVARPRTSRSSRLSICSQSIATRGGWSAWARISLGSASRRGSPPRTSQTAAHGGTASHSSVFWPTSPALPRESCAGTRISSGCGARAISRASSRSNSACSTRCALLAAAASSARPLVFRARTRIRSKRFSRGMPTRRRWNSPCRKTLTWWADDSCQLRVAQAQSRRVFYALQKGTGACRRGRCQRTASSPCCA